jgi:hypothetical protein
MYGKAAGHKQQSDGYQKHPTPFRNVLDVGF